MSEAVDKKALTEREFLVSSAPHLSSHLSARQIMFSVLAGMFPMFVAALWFYRVDAVVLTIATVAGCLVAEAVGNWMRGKEQSSLGDGSAIVTGVILAFSLPPSLDPYMAFIGGAVAIALAKAVFGGLGQNLFNPAMVGRAFLMICFPAAMVTWTPTVLSMDDAKQTAAKDKGIEVAALSAEDIDAITTATPLYQAAKYSEFIAKAGEAEPAKAEAFLAQAEEVKAAMPTQWQLFIGNVGGCIGETSALAALFGGLILVFRGIADWRQPLGVFVAVLLIAVLAKLLAPESFQGPLYYLNSGALMFGAFFIATDYVGAPITPWGRLIFGFGVGALVMIIRLFGAYPEGFMFAILIMNAITPLLERWTVPEPFGGKVPA